MKNALGVPPRHLTDSLPFSSSFELRPASFYTRLMPTPLPEPYLVCASLERYRLNLAGRDDLAMKVNWASRDIGDGLGFDILSFDETDDSERMLEVKATGMGKFSPFYVTSNEVRCSQDIPQQYQLFRVFDFGRTPRLYILHGSLRELCQLDPVLYRAVV